MPGRFPDRALTAHSVALTEASGSPAWEDRCQLQYLTVRNLGRSYRGNRGREPAPCRSSLADYRDLQWVSGATWKEVCSRPGPGPRYINVITHSGSQTVLPPMRRRRLDNVAARKEKYACNHDGSNAKKNIARSYIMYCLLLCLKKRFRLYHKTVLSIRIRKW